MNQAASPATLTQEDISQRARELWESYGRPDGRDTEIWLEAERQLLGVDAHVEGSGNTSVSASAFDEATSHEEPRTRLGKTAAVRKSGAPDDKTTKSAKTPASPKTTSAAKPSALAKTGGAKTAVKAPSTVRPKR